MLFPTQEATSRADWVSRQTIKEWSDSDTPSDEHTVGVATVHMRQDIVLIYSMLVDCHRQSVNISRGVWAVAVIGLLILVRLSV